LKLLDPAPSLAILNSVNTLLMMSGTMPSKDYIETVWGIKDCEEIKVSTQYADDYYKVFPKESKKREILDTVTSAYGDRDKNWDKYVDIIRDVFFKHTLSTLVCCPSYEFAITLHQMLKTFIPVYCEDRSTSTEIVLNILKAKRMVVLAVARGKILEGVEFLQDGHSLIDSVVIAGVPFPVPDLFYKVRASKIMDRLQIPEQNRNQFSYHVFSKLPAVMVMRQAAGRAIRTPTDHATVYYADKRFKDIQTFYVAIMYA